MKDWIAHNYPDNPVDAVTGAQQEELKRQVQEAWDTIRRETLQALVRTMTDRCIDVIMANGGYTKW